MYNHILYIFNTFSAVMNDTYTWYVELFRMTTNNSVNKTCDNVTSSCCSVEYCDRSITNQIKYFINRKTIKWYDIHRYVYSLANSIIIHMPLSLTL